MECCFCHLNIGSIGFETRECVLVICDALWNRASRMVLQDGCSLVAGKHLELGYHFSFRSDWPRDLLVGIC